MNNSNKITILTATLDAEFFIGRLIDSLRNQIDRNFEWVVVDGCSSDKTHALIDKVNEFPVRLLVSKDFGIYDALNKGVQVISEGYYLVIGADDFLLPDAIKNYRAALDEGNFDIVTTSIRRDHKIIHPNKGLGWLYGLPGVAGSHAVGMIIKVELHKNYGLYSKRFPIAADQYFVKKALAGGASILRKDFIAGDFSTEGTSGSDPVGLLTEIFRVQLLTEKYVALQFLLFAVRFLKLYIFSILRLTNFRFKKS